MIDHVIGGKVTRVLHLTLTRQWFDEIASGRKPTEYREAKRYWCERLMIADGSGWVDFREFDEIHFRNGYAKTAPWMRVEWRGCASDVVDIQGGPSGAVFAIALGRVLEIKNWKPKA